MSVGSIAKRKATQGATSLLLAVALAAGPSSGQAQGIESQSIDQLEDALEAIGYRDGPNSTALIEPLTELAFRHDENGDDLIALVAARRGVDLIRMHHGLYSLEQAPLTRQLIRSNKALGNDVEAWNIEQQLLTLARRHPDDLRSAQILRDVADRRLDILDRFVAGQWPPEIAIGCYYGRPNWMSERTTGCISGSRGNVTRRLAREAQRYYSQAIDVVLRSEEFDGAELTSLLTELVRISHEYRNPSLGSRSLRFLLAYQAASSEPGLLRIDTLTQFADWQLLHSRSLNSSESAMRIYEQVYDVLHEQQAARTFLDETFSPDVPIVLPAFVANPLVTEDRPATRGHIDVAFDVTRHGKGDDIKILDSMNSTRSDKRRLRELILRSRFRPIVTDGQFVDSRVALRYYLND